jgi:HNH endonuclease
MTREEVLMALLECAQKLGHTPTYRELRKMSKLRRFWIQKYFTSMGHAFREAGIEPKGPGHRIATATLLEDWGVVARKLGRLPSLGDYRKEGRFSIRPFLDRCTAWKQVPDGFRAHAEKCEQEKEWADVLAMISRRDEYAQAPIVFQSPAFELPADDEARPRRKIRLDRPIYGPPCNMPGLRYDPVNEQGVVFAWGMLAAKLGFEVERMQSEFPDCVAMREVERNKWQRVRIEIEYASRNFAEHKHPANGCDIIVCWIHNWPECPEEIEVIELSKVMKTLA